MGIKSLSLDHLVAWLQNLVAKLAGLGFWVNPGWKKGRKGVSTNYRVSMMATEEVFFKNLQQLTFSLIWSMTDKLC